MIEWASRGRRHSARIVPHCSVGLPPGRREAVRLGELPAPPRARGTALHVRPDPFQVPLSAQRVRERDGMSDAERDGERRAADRCVHPTDQVTAVAPVRLGVVSDGDESDASAPRLGPLGEFVQSRGDHLVQTEVKSLQVVADCLEVLMAERLVPELDELQRNPRSAAACTSLVTGRRSAHKRNAIEFEYLVTPCAGHAPTVRPAYRLPAAGSSVG